MSVIDKIVQKYENILLVDGDLVVCYGNVNWRSFDVHIIDTTKNEVIHSAKLRTDLEFGSLLSVLGDKLALFRVQDEDED